MRSRVTLVAAALSSAVLDVRFGDERPLDPVGWDAVRRKVPAYAHLAAAELRYCSPAPRCRDTGEVLGLTPLAQPALRDCDMGRWQGRTLPEVAESESAAVSQWLADPRAAPHGGETLLAFIRRIGGWLDTRPVGDDGWAVAVAEPSVVRAALCYALSAPPHAYWHLDVQPLSTATLTGRPGDWSLSLEG
ncbi:histidine phosphatase family protein [Streptomyces sp. ODS28]|uniref:histidine phosphatase family protein n=1 Tax=Streptomyces sp. ODS28 TaxID=3136688 RepID=UPI0031ECAF92